MAFEWDPEKEKSNIQKHAVSFTDAQAAFADAKRVIAEDVKHSSDENRYFCYGIVGKRVLTVRFTLRDGQIRIIGAGYWRKGKEIYNEAQ